MFLTGMGMYCVSYIFVYGPDRSWLMSGHGGGGLFGQSDAGHVRLPTLLRRRSNGPYCRGVGAPASSESLLVFCEFAHVGETRPSARERTMLSVLISCGGTMMAMRTNGANCRSAGGNAGHVLWRHHRHVIGVAMGRPLRFAHHGAYIGTLLYLALANRW